LGLELLYSSDRIRDSGGVEGNGRVEISSKVSKMLDVWVEVLESTTELCIAGDEEDGIYDDDERMKLNLIQ
jgi:hypothetical protein